MIETKTTTAKVEVIRDSLLLAEHDKQEWVDQVTREAMAVQIALRDLVDPLHRTVAPILCIHGSGPGIGRTVAGVQVVSGARLAATLSAAPSVLTDVDIQRLAAAIDERLSRQPR